MSIRTSEPERRFWKKMFRSSVLIVVALLFLLTDPVARSETRTKQGSTGFIDKLGTVVIPPRFQSAQRYSEGLAAVQNNDRWGFVDYEGRVRIDLIYEQVGSFSEGLAAFTVRRGDDFRSGFLSRNGEIVIPAKFRSARDFSEGLAAVLFETNEEQGNVKKKGGDWGYIDQKGKVVIPPQFSSARPFSEGRAVVWMGERCAIIDRAGIVSSRQRYSAAPGRFSEGLLRVKVDSKWGYVEPSGAFAIAPEYEYAYDFSEGLACVELKGRYGAINTRGEVVIAPTYEWLGMEFHQSVVGAKRKRWHLLDAEGESIAVLQNGMIVCGDLQDGRIRIRKGDLYGFLDAKGNSVIRPRFVEVDDFSEGRAAFSTLKDTLFPAITVLDESNQSLLRIGTALQKYAAAHEWCFPPAFSVDDKGRAMLSWRVHLLPYLNEDALYREFRLNEPWNSPHNKRLLERMPWVYKSFDNERANALGQTHFVAVCGDRTLFRGAKGVKLSDYVNPYKVAVVEIDLANKGGVYWSAPEDFAFDPKMHGAQLRGRHASGVRALFADAHTDVIPKDKSSVTDLRDKVELQRR